MNQDTHEKSAGDVAGEVISFLDKAIQSAPERIEVAPEPARQVHADKTELLTTTRFPDRYRPSWQRPEGDLWAAWYTKAMAGIRENGICCLIGPRGTGKTQLSAELARDFDRKASRYTTAMQFFLRVRATYKKKATESEEDVIAEMANASLLVIDELQERGETDWENKLLTHLIDRRYGAVKPTILIANLLPKELTSQLGASINDRIREAGGIIEIAGESHRRRKAS